MRMRLPRVKHVHNPIRLPDYRIRIGTYQYGVGSEMQDDAAGNIWRLLGLLDGTRTVETIVSEMLQVAPELDEQSIHEAIEAFIAGGFVEDAGAPPPSELTAAELERYSRNANYFAWIDTQPRPSPYEQQRRLKNARVTILGLGGSGSAVAMSLTAVGVGALQCVDFDRVEASNLNRQLLYSEADVGCSKVERAVARLRQLNSHVSVSGQELQVQSSADIVPLMEKCDLFVLCADAPPGQIQLWTNEAALRTRTPWLMSLYAGPMLVVGMYVPFETPCHQCFEHDQAQKRAARNGGETQVMLNIPMVNAVIAPTASLTGHLGALEAVYFLAGLQPQTAGRIFHQNLMMYDHFYYIESPFWPTCPACGSNSPYRQTQEQPGEQIYDTSN
jgi:molybdopterin/thiamine biosynthesis adenylyltransferase